MFKLKSKQTLAMYYICYIILNILWIYVKESEYILTDFQNQLVKDVNTGKEINIQFVR